MKYLVALTMMVLMFSSTSCKWLKEKGLLGRKTDTMAVWNARQDSIRVADSIMKANERIMAIEQARADSAAFAEQQRLARQKYNIVVGSFITPEYAQAWEVVYKAKGYPAKIVKLEGTDFEMVVAESHDNIGVAVQRLKHFQDNEVFDSWIYVRQ